MRHKLQAVRKFRLNYCYTDYLYSKHLKPSTMQCYGNQTRFQLSKFSR